MRKHNAISRIVALALSFAMLLQSGFVMPAFAEGKPFSAIFNYNEINQIDFTEQKVNSSYPIILPDGKNAIHGLSNTGILTTDTTLESKWPEAPYRIIGYTFTGWSVLNNWLQPAASVTETTTIDDAFLDDYASGPSLSIYGQWKRYQEPVINSGSVAFDSKNENGEYLAEDIQIMQHDDHSNTSFDRDVEEYDLYVYGDTSAMNITFDQYEPKGSSVVTVDGKAVTAEAEDITTIEGCKAWYYDASGDNFIQDNSVVTGKHYTTEYFDLGSTNATTEVEITVTLPNINIPSATDASLLAEEDENVENTGESKTYRFHIYRYGRRVKLNYGNTPYGEITELNQTNPERMAKAKQSFNDTKIYANSYYNPLAWQYKGGDENDEVIKGYPLTDNADDKHYYNFDKDDTAIVVYSGMKFKDPGIVAYDDDGNVVSLSDAGITRTIKYKYVPSLKYSNWEKENDDEVSTQLTGADDENVIELLEHNGVYENDGKFVKPGIYTIEYTYSPSAPVFNGTGSGNADFDDISLRNQTVTRYLIVLPQDGDTNMDTYLSALDSLAFDRYNSIPNGTAAYNLYLYRALDLDEDHDGVIDDKDRQVVLSRARHALLYSDSLCIKPDSVSAPEEYTPVAETDKSDNKAQLYMDYLGTSTTNTDIKNTTTDNPYTQDDEKLVETNTFYIGYRFANLAAAGLSGKLNALTLSIDYDQRYVNPAFSDMAHLVSWIKENNTNLASVTINDATGIAAKYAFDRSTASIYSWSSPAKDVKTMTVEIYPQDMTFTDGYMLKLPFVVKSVPPKTDGVHDTVISARLDAKGFNMDVAGIGYMWDTRDENNSVTTNLLNTSASGKVEYMGDCVLPFGEPKPAQVITSPVATYGEAWALNGFDTNSTAEDLPDGLVYSDTGTISGTPTLAGDYEFRVGGKRYKLKVNRAPLTVHAEPKTKVYGETNPELTFTLEGFRNDEGNLADETARKALQDDLHNEIAGKINLKCDALPNDTDTTRSNVGEYPIYFAEENDDNPVTTTNYYLVFDDSTLTVTPRKIKVTSVPIPSVSINAFPDAKVTGTADNTQFTAYYVKTVNGTDEVTADNGILTGDSISISYRVQYSGTKENAQANYMDKGSIAPVVVPAKETVDGEERAAVVINDENQGQNYEIALQEDITNLKGTVTDAVIKSFSVNEACTLKYVYGTRLNLNTGRITITYDDGSKSDGTFREMAEKGLRIRLFKSNAYTDLTSDQLSSEQTTKGYPLKVSDSGMIIHIDIESDSDADKIKSGHWWRSSAITVSKMPLTLIPLDRTRYYGFDSTAANVFDAGNTAKTGFGYRIKSDGGRIVTEAGYDDVESSIITNPQYTTTAETDSEIGNYELSMTVDDDKDNYSFSYENAILTVAPRPIKITNLSNIPALTSDYYSDSDGNSKTAPYKVPQTAVAGTLGDGVTATMTVDSSFNGGIYGTDAVKIKYNASYANSTPAQTASVTIEYDGMDTDDEAYAKSKNYVIDNSSETSFTGGPVYKRQVKKVEFDADYPVKTSYTYGEKLDLDAAENDNAADKNKIHVTYDNGETETLTFKEALNDHADDWKLTYSRDIGLSGDSNYVKTLQVADTGATLTLEAKSIYNTAETADNFKYVAALTVEKKELTVTAKDLYTTYGEAIPSFDTNTVIDITGFENGDTRSVLTAQPRISCYEDNGTTPIVPGQSTGTPAGTYTLYVDGAAANNYKFHYTTVEEGGGELTVSQRAIRFKKIKIDDLTSKQAYDAYKAGVRYSKTVTVDTNDTDIFEYAENCEPLTWNGVKDNIQIRFIYTFTEAPLEGKENVEVNISNAEIIRPYGSDRSYYLPREIPTQHADVKGEKIKKITVINDPTLDKDIYGNIIYENGSPKRHEYTYGDYLLSGIAKIEWDNEREDTQRVLFKNLSDYHITVKNPYTDENITDWDHIFLKMGENKKLTLVPDDDFKADDYDGADASTGNILVVKRKINVIVNNAEYTYGDTIDINSPVFSETPVEGKYSYRFDTMDFAVGETTVEAAIGSSYTKPKLLCVDTAKNPNATVDQTSEAGTYKIVVDENNAGYSENYEFIFDEEYDSGTLTINKRDIKITAFNQPPMLTAALIRQNEIARKAKIEVPGSAQYSDDTGTGSVTAENVVNKDTIGITYTALYDASDTEYTTKTDVDIDTSSVKFDDSADENGNAKYPKNKNYNIIFSADKSEFGSVEKSQISEIIVETDPKMSYNYGEFLNFTGGKIIIKFRNNDDYHEETTFDKLDEYGITPTYEVTGKTVQNKDRLTVTEHDGQKIILTLDEDNTVTGKTKTALSIAPHAMRVVIDPQSFVYGSEPPKPEDGSFTPDSAGYTDYYHYTSGDLVNGDSFLDDDFTDGLEKEIPELHCAATSTSNAGTYDITGASKIRDAGKKSNYTFIYPEKGVMTVERKPVVIKSIDSGIPTLTSKIIRDDKRTTHTLSSAADSDGTDSKITVEGLVGSDNIRVLYDATYDKTTPAGEADVAISYTGVDDSYKESANYIIAPSSTDTAVGVIENREIEAISIERQPNLEYTYGEKLNLKGGRVRITYDDGSVEDVTFANLPADKTKLTYNDGTEASDGDVLDVKYHNGNAITIKVIGPHTVPDNKTEQITVYKRRLRVKANPVTMYYGDTPVLSWEYVDADNDFVNGDNRASLSFTRGMKAPVISCVDDSGVSVSNTTNVGKYDIVLSSGSANNYEFEYTNSVLTIEKRPIDINSINSGIPMLTAKFLSENKGPNYRLSGSAINTEGQMTVGNLVNNDTIKINYTAVYNAGAPSDKVTVNIENAALDNNYARSSNYRLAYVTASSPNGSINKLDIEAMTIVRLPKMEYSYGDRLSLNGGIIHIVYDDGTEKDVAFDEISGAGNSYGISLKYSGTDRRASSGDILDIDNYNGKRLEITVNDSIYNVGSRYTDPLTINKRVLYYGTCQVDDITYDGSTVTTTGTVIFTNTANGEVPEAETATFTFTDYNAGKDIPVNITGITLKNEWTHNYELSEDHTTATGNINKAATNTPAEEVKYEFSTVTNTLTVTPLTMDEAMAEGGAKFEYSIDGENWQESNVFEDIDIGRVCTISVRYAETDNYLVSQATAPVNAQSHTAKITLISRDKPEEGEDNEILASFYTYVTEVAKENDLKELIGDIEKEEKKINYYSLTEDLEGKTSLKYPLELLGDVKIYTTLRAPSSGGGGIGGGGAVPRTTATPKPTESPQPTGSPAPTATPVPTATPSSSGKRNIPYMSGFDGMIKPDDYMTRAEAATIMVMVNGDTGEQYENVFPDVGEDTWYVRYIAEAYARGLIEGFDDGNFYPEDTVTREQFAAMVVRMIGLEPIPGATFTDVEEQRWSAASINATVRAGIIEGYEDGTFLPENPTKRSEAVRMINMATGRIPNKELVDTLICPYTDLPKNHWAYYELMIAATEFDIPE